jgi:hypothetical protein
MIIKGWRKLKASNHGLSSWVANEGKDNEVILSLLRTKDMGKLKIVRKLKNSNSGETLQDRTFKIPEYAYDSAIAYMKTYPHGYREAMIGK